MNLTTDPWIPIVWESGKSGTVSLGDAFSRGQAIRDLSVRPHERIALMRLLICIAQAALDGPLDVDGWRACRERIVPAALDYLARWRGAFELFGANLRFLQVKGRGNPGTMELDKLAFVDADMTTLFDQDVVLGRSRDPSWIALRLTAYQSFAAGGTVGGSDVIEGKLQPQKGKNGPCRDSSAFHAFIRRAELLSTVHTNLLAKSELAGLQHLEWGRPIWEFGAMDLAQIESQADIPRSYLGRLVPLSRSVWLNDDCTTASMANGLSYPAFADEGIRDSTTTVRVVRDRAGQEKRVLLGASERENIKRPWRELHALAVKRITNQGVGGPLTLMKLEGDADFDLWVGALVTGKAKIEDTVESTCLVPAGMLFEPAQRAYEMGVRHAQDWEGRLRRAISIYRLGMETNEDQYISLQRRMMRLKRTEQKRMNAISNKVHSTFWTQVEQRLDLLNRFATEAIPMQDGEVSWRTTDWGRHIRRIARNSYEWACPHETARQIRAYALGQRVLIAEPQQQHAEEEAQP